MIGGGFLGQMHETMKRNRELIRAALRKSKRRHFDNGEYRIRGESASVEDKKLTDSERQALIQKTVADNQRDRTKRILILVVTSLIVITTILAVIFYS